MDFQLLQSSNIHEDDLNRDCDTADPPYFDQDYLGP